MKTLLYSLCFLSATLSLSGSLITQSTWVDSPLGAAGRTTVVTSNGSNLNPWYLVNSGGASNFVVTEDSGSGKSGALARSYAAITSFDPYTLEIGESMNVNLTLRYSVTPTSGAEGLRLILLNSGTHTPPSSDVTSVTGQADYVGYSFLLGASGDHTSNTQSRIRRRSAGGWLGTNSGEILTGNRFGINDSDLSHQIQLILKRNADSMDLEVYVDGNLLISAQDTNMDNSAYWTYNTFVISNNVDADGSPLLYISDFSIGSIPEPAAMSLMFGALIGAGFWIRNRRVKA